MDPFPEILDPSELLSLRNVFGLEGILAFSVLIPFIVAVALRPSRFWPLLIIGNVLGLGLRLRGYPILDELITGCLVLGACLSIVVNQRRLISHQTGHDARLVFRVFIIYLVCQSVIGIVTTGDARNIRWLLLYVLVGVVSNIASRYREFEFPDPRTAWTLILCTTALYDALYIAQGVYGQIMFPEPGLWGEPGRFRVQNYLWTGPALAVLPTLLGMPAALCLMHDRSRRIRTLAWLVVLMSIVVAYYFDSRLAWSVVLSSMVISLRRLRLKRVLLGMAIAAVVLGVLAEHPVADAKSVIVTLYETSQMLWKPNDSDIGRNIDFKVAWMAIGESPLTFLIGHGIGSHKTVAIPYLEEMFRRDLPAILQWEVISGSPNDPDNKLVVYRTTAFTALLVDTGVIGMMLFTACFVLLTRRLLTEATRERPLLILCVVLAFIWIIAVNVLDTVLFYLILMPDGILFRLSGARALKPTMTMEATWTRQLASRESQPV